MHRHVGWMWIVLAAPMLAAAAEPVKVAPFSLPGSDGKPVAPLAAKNQKLLVAVFLGTECPINNAYLPRLNELKKEFAGQGVGFVGINSNQMDTAAEVAEHAKKFELTFPVLKDEGNKIADAFGAKRTPEAFLLDADGTIQYRGRIDDQNGIGFRRVKASREDLVEAIKERLAGKPVSVASAEVAGCPIARVAVRPTKPEATTVTYVNRIAEIVEKNCAECHRAGQIGPMSLRDYDSLAAWSGAIQEAVSDNRMPPWHADPTHGSFSNDRRLAKEDRAALLSWIEAGCPKGEGDAPKGRDFSDGWTIGKPDLVLTMEQEYKVPADMPKRGIPYKYFYVDPKFTEDMWVTAAEARPGARSVVHHIIVYIAIPGERRTRNEDGIGNNLLTGYVPGDFPLQCPEGTARKIPKGALLVFQMHYTPNGKEQIDRSSLGLIFAKKPPKFESKSRAIATNRFAIPPGDSHHKVVSSTVFKEPAQLQTLTPHMHLRGKTFEYQVVYPDGKREVLLKVPNYDFNWQTTYRLAKPLDIPAGTRIECTAHFDNSEKNPHNPDPTKTVRWGDQTWEEMMIGFTDYIVREGK